MSTLKDVLYVHELISWLALFIYPRVVTDKNKSTLFNRLCLAIVVVVINLILVSVLISLGESCFDFMILMWIDVALLGKYAYDYGKISASTKES